jgi:hypothetical protein
MKLGSRVGEQGVEIFDRMMKRKSEKGWEKQGYAAAR